MAYVKSFIKDRQRGLGNAPLLRMLLIRSATGMRFDRDLTVIEYGAGTGSFYL